MEEQGALDHHLDLHLDLHLDQQKAPQVGLNQEKSFGKTYLTHVLIYLEGTGKSPHVFKHVRSFSIVTRMN